MEVDDSQFQRNEEDTEDQRRINRNVGKQLDDREPGPEDRVDKSLSPRRQGAKCRGRGSNQAQSKWGAKGRKGSSDTGARGSNEPPPRGKRPVRELRGLASPEGITKMARVQWTNDESRMRRQNVSEYPTNFMYHAGELHFVATDVL